MEKVFLQTLTYFGLVASPIILLLLFRAKEHKSFFGLTALLSVRLISDVLCIGCLQLCHWNVLPSTVTYPVYFCTYWIGFSVEAVLYFLIILNIFKLAMAPLEGLRSLGMIVFRWAAVISVVLALALSLSPSKSAAATTLLFLSEFQQVSNVITLCLLCFVCFAIRPLGLNYRSRVFGVALGLGFLATSGLAQAAWFNLKDSLYTTANVIAGVGTALSVIVWIVYFALPEPKRRIIVLPTTSPFLRWNQISEVLGDNPGYVAFGGVPPELLAPAEIEVMVRASVKMREIEQMQEEVDPSFNSISA